MTQDAWIEIVAEPPRFLVFARWVKVSIAIDGELARLRWGTHAFRVAPGEHVIDVGVGHGFGSKARTTVTTAAGEMLRLRYTPRVVKILRGTLAVELLAPARVVVR